MRGRRYACGTSKVPCCIAGDNPALLSLTFMPSSDESSLTMNERYVGGTALKNIITGEHLRDLFTRETLQDHFEALSDTLGFTLSMYADAGKPIFVPKGAYPICNSFRSQSSDLKSRCDQHCHPFILNTLTTGKPHVFKCYA